MKDETRYSPTNFQYPGVNGHNERHEEVTEDVTDNYNEEVAGEIAVPTLNQAEFMKDSVDDEASSGSVFGYAGLALSILSLFILPVILGASGIIIGFVARRRGATTLGSWAVGIGAVSIIVGLFVLPFF
ncbi:hypothetical protein Q73_09490 [Bacillus coahuilensis m2-6]|uniref:DUF4190 domain-containing protein n=1 Tax=Bacillus coahuilensis p1.1.43 TaxID=1150625 RepID=A0A147K7D9_9BACI|nr:hypothetical protein [Bacillus coahuilensis]KUP05998.1 hypothetical protein Q75_10070 [Bacillus coahuilensis p1.1.43]KUP07213.1 hypothetical protein Q73_09490 [Bacillus coahuilensis m2-6]